MYGNITNSNVAGHPHPIIITILGFSFSPKHDIKHPACQMKISFPCFKEAQVLKNVNYGHLGKRFQNTESIIGMVLEK